MSSTLFAFWSKNTWTKLIATGTSWYTFQSLRYCEFCSNTKFIEFYSKTAEEKCHGSEQLQVFPRYFALPDAAEVSHLIFCLLCQ